MNSPRSLRAALGLALALLAPAVGRGDDPPAVRPDDRAYVDAMLARAKPLCDEEVARPRAELARQLDRGPLAARPALPATSDAALAPDALYGRRSRGVLALGRIYKCPRCSNWHVGNQASAFVLTDDGLCATCHHVFDGGDDGPMVAADAEGNAFPVVEVVAASRPDDIALFRIDLGRAQPADAPRPEPVPLRPAVPVGTPINVLSHPDGRFYLLTRGIVARRVGMRGGIGGDLRGRRGETPTLNITADYAVGSSGAPVLDDAGNAVGMVVQTHTIRAGHEGDSPTQMILKTCTPADQILRLLGPTRPATAAR